MANKKVVFVLVEGPSDQDALGSILSKLYDKDAIYVHVLHGDITSRKGVHSGNIIAKIGNEVRNECEKNKFKKENFKEIIHVVDMDGAFVSDKVIVEDDSLKKVIYDVENIRCRNKASIEDRNSRKRGNINRICACNKIYGIPYSVYYMSCNLDHVLYNKLNLTDEEKEKNSISFAKKYREDVDGFVFYISNSAFSVNLSYTESWNYIKTDNRSLQRYTNFGLSLPEQTNESN